jgi:hypothetical protein
MTDKIEVKLGQKIEQPAPGTLDLSKTGLLISMPPKDQVEGQYTALTTCPYCGNTGWTSGLDTDYYINVVCGRCGLVFRA